MLDRIVRRPSPRWFLAVVACGAIGLIATRGGAAGVGQSTTGAVVIAIILIFVSNFILSFLLFG